MSFGFVDLLKLAAMAGLVGGVYYLGFAGSALAPKAACLSVCTDG